MAAILGNILEGAKRKFDELLGNDSDTKVRRPSVSEVMLWTLL